MYISPSHWLEMFDKTWMDELVCSLLFIVSPPYWAVHSLPAILSKISDKIAQFEP